MTPIAIARDIRLYVTEDGRCPSRNGWPPYRTSVLKPGSVNDLTAWRPGIPAT